MPRETAVIIGAGPAGLTAAYELAHRTGIRPIVLEASGQIGGLAQTVEYKGNRIDIGGHRFFSRSGRVMQWWQSILPLQGGPIADDRSLEIAYQNQRRMIELSPDGPDPRQVDRVMLVRNRVSRIFFRRRFFGYPLALNLGTVRSLGLARTARVAASYLRACVRPVRPERSLEDFLINRFGRELYRTFFKAYTEKVWGVSCHRIPAEWGVQRVKGLSISRAVAHAVLGLVGRDATLGQKRTETSLIERFLYPKYGPGQMWQETARLVREQGGEIHLNHAVIGLKAEGTRIITVQTSNALTGEAATFHADHFLSSMPVADLVRCLGRDVPADVREIAAGLVYRDFITVGLLLRRLRISGDPAGERSDKLIPDNWIYIQEPDVRVGRLQVYNNWSPFLVRDPDTVWLGLEYFVNEGDELWRQSDAAMTGLAVDELTRLGFIAREDLLDSVVIRMPKAYPAYFGTYDRFHVVRAFLDRYENLFLIGRNGMHRYNNQDHSMLTAMAAVENIIRGIATKDNIWQVNADQEYHEEAG